MEIPENSVELQIIRAAIECIEKYGLTGVTNRRIAEIAGVSNAAINYYFRRKEYLIKKVMEITVHTAFNWELLKNLPGSTPRERCIAVFETMAKGAVEYPGIMRAHFYDLMTEKNFDSFLENPYNQFIDNLSRDLLERGANLSLEEIRFACSQIASACFMLILVPKMNVLQLDIKDEKVRHGYVSRLVEKFL